MMKKNMKKLNILLVCAMSILLLFGCGNNDEKVSLAEKVETENIEIDEVETVDSDATEDSQDTSGESIEEESTYIEQNDIFLLSDACNDGIQIDLSSFEFVSKEYSLTKSVDIYYTDGTLAGYTKDNALVYVISSGDEWSFCSFDTDGFLIKKDELMDSILIEEEKVDNVVEQPEVQNSIHSDTTVESDAKATATDKAVDEVAVAPDNSSKYTPDEAIAVYRSLMEAGGITWDPSIKDVTSWGTGWIYLEKGMPEWAAETDLESFAMGDSGGRSWTKYYLEVTGSDENAVYITQWSSN